ncbi:uncharacterized protein LOC130898054 [Diorhabda carinulata]|uniref:uncharacterized protein LOC130898054 n=1 Tax=Diorhabda carinulata TaxID=1163345 RepID=UPI0025A3026E|nr:uncharacterized protein LOC130898054 [Diorhabda carinulata]
MILLRNLAVLILVAATFAQDYYDDEPQPSPRARPAPARVQPGYSGPNEPRATPVPILKQINRHNEDGSYTYGYESADGTFKIETKLPTGDVKGKYGYIDDTGKVRVVEYGATKYGFDPSGEGITVPPPTLVDESQKEGQQQDLDYYEPQTRAQIPPRRAQVIRPKPQPRPQPSFQEYSPPQQFEPAPARPAAGPAQIDFDFGPPSRPAPTRAFVPVSAPRPRPLQIPGAQPAPINEDFEPAPIRTQPRVTYAQPASAPSRPAPVAFERPAPRFSPAPAPAPVYQPRPAPSVPSAGRSGGILDQLSKDYALPSGGAAPLHDISFGYY